MITIKNLIKTYTNGEIETKVLRDINLTINRGEFVAIMGKSGAGKSTLLYQMSLLDVPTGGDVVVDETDISGLSDPERTDFRLSKLGYIFQDYALVPELSAEENICIPLLMEGVDETAARTRARKIIDDIGMEGKYNNLPNQLSGGQQQRISIARGMVQNPEILFADEPTANLDSSSSHQVIDLLRDFHQKGQTIVMVTHEKEYTKYCDRIIYIEDGQVSDNQV